jgi:hypothetical protein
MKTETNERSKNPTIDQDTWSARDEGTCRTVECTTANHAAWLLARALAAEHLCHQLSQFINAHCGCRCLSFSEDCTLLNVQSDVLIAGQLVPHTEQINADLESVRDWLGY